MTDLSERKRVYEVLVKQAERWTVVDVFEDKEDALAQGARMRIGHAAVRVTIERFNAETKTYTSTVIWEWQAPKRAASSVHRVGNQAEARLHHLPPPKKKEPPRPWWRRWLGL